MISVIEQIFLRSKNTPKKIAIFDGKKEVTYLQLKEAILNAKSYLENSFQLKKSDRIILAADKNVEFIYSYFAIHLIGAIAIPVAADINEERLCFIIENTKTRCLLGLTLQSDLCTSVSFSELRNYVSSNNAFSFPELDNVADLLYTTGTTGAPKGVQLNHNNLKASVRNINSFIGNRTEDVELIALPISHSFGLGRIRCVLAKGGTVVLLGSFVNVKKFYRLIKEHHVTGLAMVPSAWKFLKKMSGDRISDFQNQLRYLEFGSAFLPIEDKQDLMNLLPHTRICMHYGLTEASRSCFIEFHAESDKLHTIGKASPNVQVKIFNEKGDELGVDEEGEICVKGEHVLQTYWKLKSNKCFFGDYFRTGDLGYFDEYDYIVLSGRLKETINVGGKKLNPIEVESYINEIDGVEESVCIGIPDKNGVLGEVVKAYVVKSESKLVFKDIHTVLEERLENYKVPVEYEWIEEVPKTKSGKIQRLKLKKK